jgi:hypothetical protein
MFRTMFPRHAQSTNLHSLFGSYIAMLCPCRVVLWPLTQYLWDIEWVVIILLYKTHCLYRFAGSIPCTAKISLSRDLSLHTKGVLRKSIYLPQTTRPALGLSISTQPVDYDHSLNISHHLLMIRLSVMLPWRVRRMCCWCKFRGWWLIYVSRIVVKCDMSRSKGLFFLT